MSDNPPVRYRNTVLYDRGGIREVGDVLLHARRFVVALKRR